MDQSEKQRRREAVIFRRAVVKRLQVLGAYLFYSAQTGSQYVKFTDPRLGSLRIGDHGGREKYRYKWNLLKGQKEFRREQDRSIVRRYYDWKQAELFYEEIVNEQERLLAQFGPYNAATDPYAADRMLGRESGKSTSRQRGKGDESNAQNTGIRDATPVLQGSVRADGDGRQ
jgi:hypothetical protein